MFRARECQLRCELYYSSILILHIFHFYVHISVSHFNTYVNVKLIAIHNIMLMLVVKLIVTLRIVSFNISFGKLLAMF